MRKWPWFFIGIAAASLGVPAAAQNVQSGTEQGAIVVQGRRDRDAEIRELVDSLTPTPPNGHIARFEHAACPAVLGLPPAQKAIVVRRMRAVGAAAGVPMGSPECRPNVLLLVTSDKRHLIEEMQRRFPDYLGELSRRQIARLAQSNEPAVLWHLDGLVDSEGRQLDDPAGGMIVNRAWGSGSRITDPAHMEFVGSVLVVEARVLPGFTTVQLADYAAMRTFTGADPARLPNQGLPTILTLLAAPIGASLPITLTNWDLAFLRSFYASDVNIHAPGQRGEIQAGMRRGLDQAEDGADHH